MVDGSFCKVAKLQLTPDEYGGHTDNYHATMSGKIPHTSGWFIIYQYRTAAGYHTIGRSDTNAYLTDGGTG